MCVFDFVVDIYVSLFCFISPTRSAIPSRTPAGHEHTHGDGGHDSGHSHGHGHSHEHGNPHADDDHANHAMVGRLDAAEPFDTHDQQQTTTTTTTELQRALPQLVEELAGAVLTQTRQLQQQ